MTPRAAAIAFVVLAGCSSLPREIRDAKRLTFSMTDAKIEQALVLTNDDDVFRTLPRRDSVAVKRAMDEEIRDLLEFAASRGLFDREFPECVDNGREEAVRFDVVGDEWRTTSRPSREALISCPDVGRAVIETVLAFMRAFNRAPGRDHHAEVEGARADRLVEKWERFKCEEPDRMPPPAPR